MKFLICLALFIAAAQAGVISPVTTYSAGVPLAYSAAVRAAVPAAYTHSYAAPLTYAAPAAYATYNSPSIYTATYPAGAAIAARAVTYSAPSVAYSAPSFAYSAPAVYSTLLKK